MANKKYNPVGWFEIPVLDMERAVTFYEGLFGFEMKRQEIEGYEMVWFPNDTTLPSISGALLKGPGYKSGETGIVIYFSTDNIDDILGKAEAMGSRVVLPKKDIGDNGYIGWMTDSEDNVIGIHQSK